MPDHHPPHIFLNDTWYMVTSATNLRQRLLAPNGHKELLRDRLKELTDQFKLQLAGWVILDNHYHILVRCEDGSSLTQFIKRLHGGTAFELNKMDGKQGRQVWHNYWDTCICSEADYWTRFNYIHHNPVKHGYVCKMDEWPFSSLRYYLDRRGREWVMDAFYRYPVVDFTDGDGQF
jgi:putative transposase